METLIIVAIVCLAMSQIKLFNELREFDHWAVWVEEEMFKRRKP